MERLLVRDLMKVGVATCPPDTPIQAVANLLLDDDLEGVIVLDFEGHAIGVVTHDELVRGFIRADHATLTAKAIMREDIPVIPPDIPLVAAAQLMQDQHIRVFYLMHNADGVTYPAAVLSYRHFVRYLAGDDLSDLGHSALRRNPIETFIERRDAARRQAKDPHTGEAQVKE